MTDARISHNSLHNHMLYNHPLPNSLTSFNSIVDRIHIIGRSPFQGLQSGAWCPLLGPRCMGCPWISCFLCEAGGEGRGWSGFRGDPIAHSINPDLHTVWINSLFEEVFAGHYVILS